MNIKDNASTSFAKDLKYELLFRNLGKQVFSELKGNPPGRMTTKNLVLLSKMEQHNTEVMSVVRGHFDVDNTIRCKDKILAKTVIISLKVMPDIGTRYLEGSAERFVHQLEEIQATSPEGYEEEMAYMVGHEKALYGYLVHLNKGEQQRAHAVLEQFVSENNIQ
ncbi:hypothetical protein [Shewanella sp. UCD-FRSSP16_17]|uniref:hypothetical protein n=1 Tax=Shewanella sp. UCD-FRSSP16_17 TaxID=1853256 RepID=UPI0018D2D2C9|nr:hypothetical protein [Shewanella sp. UCD-FRSSP16_17]